MSLPGYDLRKRSTRRVSCYTSGTSGGVNGSSAGHAWEKTQSTTSYRSSIEGVRLHPEDVDPYMGFFSRENDFSRVKLRSDLRTQLEASGLAEFADYEVNGFVDNGHPFSTETHQVGTSLRMRSSYWDQTRERRHGGPSYVTGAAARNTTSLIFPIGGSDGKVYVPNRPLPLTLRDQQTLEADGKRAIVAASPGRPQVDTTQFVAELLSRFPSIPGRALLTLRDLPAGGDEWLNLLFGVIPTYGDGVELGKTLLDISRQLVLYRANAGKFLRRSFRQPQSVRTQIVSNNELRDPGYIKSGPGYGFNPVHHGGYAGDHSAYRYADSLANPNGRVETEFLLSEVRDFSFSGSFTYYIPQSPAFWGRLGKYAVELDRVIGLGLDPTTVWELGPWSWLADWFFDIRESLTLMEISQDTNLVMNYGYAMETLTRTVAVKSQNHMEIANGGATMCRTYTRSAVKRRVRANPYGFVRQTDTGVFDAYRLSILSALGLSRLR